MVKIDKKWCYFHLKWCYLHLRWCYLRRWLGGSIDFAFSAKSKKNCGDISQQSPAFCMYEREKEEKKQIKARGKIYDDMMIITIVIFWQREAKVIGIQKMYGLFGLNNHIKKKTCDVTPVTKRRTEESRK